MVESTLDRKVAIEPEDEASRDVREFIEAREPSWQANEIDYLNSWWAEYQGNKKP